MALNSSGPISLAGATAGQSISIELGGNGTTQISLDDPDVRTLAGVATGAITMPTNFYGKSFAINPTVGLFFGGYNPSLAGMGILATRINACGALIGSQTNVSTNNTNGEGGAPIGVNGVYYGGLNTPTRITRINKCGVLVGTANATGSSMINTAGSPVGSIGMYFGGYVYNCCGSLPQGRLSRINACGGLIAQAASVAGATARGFAGGALVGSNALFYGGANCSCQGIPLNTATRVNVCGTVVGSQTSAGTSRYSQPGAPVGSNGIYYGGIVTSLATVQNKATRINACGALVGAETSVGTARTYLAGARVGTVGVYYGGQISVNRSNLTTRINACGAIVGSETAIGTARAELAGAGI